MTQLLPNGKQQFIDINGKPLVGGQVFHYEVGTLTPKTTYQDAGQTIPNTNPVVLDARGQASIYGTGAYRQILKDVVSVTIWDAVVPDVSTAVFDALNLFKADLATNNDPAKGAALVGFFQAGAGAVGQTLMTKARNIVTAEDFGAIGDGVADDTAALQAAATAMGVIRGGAVLCRNRYLINSANLTLPENVALVGTWSPFGQLPFQSPAQAHNLSCTLILNTSFSIIMSAGAQLEKLSIIRKGLTVGEATTAAFAGTAIKGLGTAPNEMDGIRLSHLQILGFALGGQFDQTPRMEVEYVSGDNLAGLKFGVAFDVLRVKNCHMWPFITIGAGGVGVAHNRTGAAYEFSDRTDIMQCEGCFSYGYFWGFKMGAQIGTCTFIECAADGTALYPNSIGWLFSASATYTTCIGCIAYSNDYGFWLDPLAADTITFTNCRAVGNITDAAHLVDGGSRWVNCIFASSVSGVVAVGPSISADISGCTFVANSANNIAGIGSPQVRVDNCKFDNASAVSGFTPPILASADPLPLPMTGDFFAVSGTTNWGALPNGWSGRRVTLYFTGTMSVTSSGGAGITNMHLAGGVNFAATPNDILNLIHNGTYWTEASRSVNA